MVRAYLGAVSHHGWETLSGVWRCNCSPCRTQCLTCNHLSLYSGYVSQQNMQLMLTENVCIPHDSVCNRFPKLLLTVQGSTPAKLASSKRRSGCAHAPDRPGTGEGGGDADNAGTASRINANVPKPFFQTLERHWDTVISPTRSLGHDRTASQGFGSRQTGGLA